LILARQFESAPDTMMAFVKEKLQPHAIRIVFAAGKTAVLRKAEALGVVSREMSRHSGNYKGRSTDVSKSS